MGKANKIMKSAYKLFAEKGYENTPVSEVASKAEVATGTVIYHFKSKENLLCTLHWQFLNSLISTTNRNMLYATTGSETLEIFIKTFFTFVQTHPDECKVLLMDKPFKLEPGSHFAPGPAAELKRLVNQYGHLLTSAIARGTEDGSLQIKSPKDFTISLASMLIGGAWLVLFFGEDIQASSSGVLDYIGQRCKPLRN